MNNIELAQSALLIQELEKPDNHGTSDLKKRAADTIRRLARDNGPPPDNTVRNVVLNEAAHQMRLDNERAVAKRDMNDDDAIVSCLREIEKGKEATLISLTARFAGELQHNLIHPALRKMWKDSASESDKVRSDLIKQTFEEWRHIFDPGLVGNASIACKNIEQSFPDRLRGLNVDIILNTDMHEPLEYFCAVTAARWRANSVFSAGPYKTGKEQNAVIVALNDSIALFSDYVLMNGTLMHMPRRAAPQTLSELRNMYE